MAFSKSERLPWHSGEQQMHKLMHVPPRLNPNSPFLTPGAGFMVQNAPLLVLGALDHENRPWTAVYGGEAGFAQPMGNSIIGVNTLVDKEYDPVVNALLGGSDDEVVEEEGERKLMGGLAIDLETRSRVKLHGNLIAGALGGADEEDAVKHMQLAVSIDKSVGNCPKYINKKHIIPSLPNPKLVSGSAQLSPEAVSLLAKSDLFFMSSTDGIEDIDTNNRGGPPGLVRVLSNSPTGAVLIYPEYSGNRLYESLGNLRINPLAGITVPDFETGDVLYMTGKTEILMGEAASTLLLRSNLAIKFTVTAARFVSRGLAFKGIAGELSPYNPPVRYAFNEPIAHAAVPNTTPTSATLINVTELTPSISRFRFSLDEASSLKGWKPGQYATLEFESFLDKGYSHMRDEDPKSLNDDYLRTFTISSPPSKESVQTGNCDAEFELTIRNVGRATNFLFEQGKKINRKGKKAFKIPLKGFEGEFRFEKKDKGGVFPFIAGGIGITPVLGQISSMDVSQLRLLWGIGLNDIGLVADTLKRSPELVDVTTLFLTGDEADVDIEQQELFSEVKKSGVRIERRRMEKRDVDAVDGDGDRESLVKEWYMCVGPGLKSNVLNWLAGKRIVYEDFSY